MYEPIFASRIATFVLLLIISVGIAHAQSKVVVRAVVAGTHLTGREHEGKYYGISVSRDVSSRFYISGKAGYLRSVQTNWVVVPPPNGLYRWRKRQHYMLDAGAGWYLIRIRTGSLRHRFGPTFGISYRYRREEIVGRTYQPAYFDYLPEDMLEAMLHDCDTNPHKHCFRYDDGPGIGIDGQYVVFTGPARTSDFGFVGGFMYHVRINHLALGLEAGLYRYLRQERKWGGTHTYYYGGSVGYAF